MKLLFLGLLLINLGLFGWMRFAADRPAPAIAPPQASTTPSLLLRSELAARQPAAGPGRCVSSGPLDEAAAAALEQRARSRGLAASLRRSQRLEPLGFWVYLPPAESLEAAQATGRRLAGKGVSDFVFVVGAEKANAISLGLFADRLAAEMRVAELQALGFETRLEQRYAARESVAVVLDLKAGQAAPAEPAARWQPVDCQAPGQ